MALTDEYKKEYKRQWYLKNQEREKAKYLQFYQDNKHKIHEQRSRKRLAGRFCRLCEVKLDGLCWAFRNRKYCAECRQTGQARKHIGQLSSRKYYMANRETL